MDKNYYKILEVDKSASKEVIEKVYKILAKKYHPDLQDESNKQFYENKLKAINEAYDILSDPIKRNQYDSELKAEELKRVEKINNKNISDKEFEALFNENLQLKNTIKQLKEVQSQEYKNNEDSFFNNDYINQKHINQKQQNKQKFKNYSNFNNNNFNYSQYNHQINDAINKSINKAYHDAYIQDLKNRGYKIRYKKTLKDYIRNFIALVITIFILFLVFQIPFVKNYFVDLYNTNVVIQSIVDFITNLFN